VSSRARLLTALFIWLLPFHAAVMMLLVGPLGFSIPTVRAVAAWKEVAVLMFLGSAAATSLGGYGSRTGIRSPDVAVSACVALALAFLAAENSVFRADIPLTAELYGFRDSFFFLLLYYVGRATPALASERVVRHVFAMGVVISLIAVLERLFVPTETLVLLGAARYVQDFLGLSAFTEGTGVGLPQNYWTIIGGTAVRRAGSVFMHSQGLALPFLLLIPAATALVLGRSTRPSAIARIGYAILWTGLLLSITRMTIVVCLVQVVLFYAMVRRPEWAVGTVITAIAAFAVFLALVPGLATFVWETLTWQTGSSESHVGAWSSGALAFLERPWGSGLGTTEAAAARAGLVPITGDNMFLSYGVQLGLAGLLAQLAIMLGLLSYSWRVFRTSPVPQLRLVGAVVCLTTVGILLNGATSLVFSSTLLAYLYFLLAGALVTASEAAARLRPQLSARV
jgi:hypothetical protein